jgi:hypothetical protein
MVSAVQVDVHPPILPACSLATSAAVAAAAAAAAVQTSIQTLRPRVSGYLNLWSRAYPGPGFSGEAAPFVSESIDDIDDIVLLCVLLCAFPVRPYICTVL